MSSVWLEIISELEAIVKDFRDSLVSELKPDHTSTPEEIQALHKESIKRNTYLWGRLSNVTLRVATATSAPTQERDHEAIARMMLDGTVKYFMTARLTAFTRRCRDLLPPSKAEFNKVSRLRLHEMIFLPSDCFSELSNISPGCHGWIFIFRTDLKEWLLKTIDPFFMTYQNLNGQKTEFGVYEAIQFSEGNMAGPEIARLSQSTQNIIVAQVSKDAQKKNYNVVRKALLESQLPLSCFLLQCREMPAPSSIFTQGRPSISKTDTATFSQNRPKPKTMQVSYQMRATESGVLSRPSVSSTVTRSPWAVQPSQYSAPFRVFPSSESRGGFTAPVIQSDCELQAKSTQPGVAGPTSTLNIAENTSHVPVPGPVPNEHGWFNEGFHTSPPAAHQNHPSKNHHQDQIQFRESQGQVPSRLRTVVDGKQSASYGIPLHVSTNTRGPAFGYTTQNALQLPTSRVPQNNYQRSHDNNRNQNQNIHPALLMNSGFSRATVGGAHTNGYQQQPCANPSLVVRPQLPGTQAHDFRRQIRP